MSLDRRLSVVLDEIQRAALAAGRKPEDVTLVCVSKKTSVQDMLCVADLLRAKGIPIVFGESYVQEFEQKRGAVPADVKCHLIGPLQSNKAAKAVKLFDAIESIHSEKILREVNKEAQKAGKVMPIFVQVNISRDTNKAGFDVDQLENLFTEIIPYCTAVAVQGLMTITELYENSADVRGDFQALAQSRDRLSKLINLPLSLSMGMSADYQIAIAEGATHVRVGSAIFKE